MRTYTVDLGERSYPIHIGSGVLKTIGEEVKRLGATRVLVVTNTTVGPLYEKPVMESLAAAVPEVPAAVVRLPDGESYKDLAHVEIILSAASNVGLDRKSVMVALGGGVVGDMTGFAAAMWMRGIRFIQIPTTLLAQVDSSVGGKTGVNLSAGKNLIGAFHQPSSVLIDPTVLKTLPAREVSAGLAEVVKYGFLGDAAFVAQLETDMPALRSLDFDTIERTVEHCCRMKAAIVHEDEREGGVRAKLNLGHTFGHAVEKLTGYGTYLHGEAVGIGTVMAADLSRRLGYLTAEDVIRVTNLVKAAGLPVRVEGLSAEEAYRAMQGDKKSVGGTIRFVVMTAVGKTVIEIADRALVFDVMHAVGWRSSNFHG